MTSMICPKCKSINTVLSVIISGRFCKKVFMKCKKCGYRWENGK